MYHILNLINFHKSIYSFKTLDECVSIEDLNKRVLSVSSEKTECSPKLEQVEKLEQIAKTEQNENSYMLGLSIDYEKDQLIDSLKKLIQKVIGCDSYIIYNIVTYNCNKSYDFIGNITVCIPNEASTEVNKKLIKEIIHNYTNVNENNISVYTSVNSNVN